MGLWEYAAQQAQKEQQPQEEQQAQEPQGTQYAALARQQGQERENRERAAAVYKMHQDNVKKTGEIQSEILKGLQAGEDLTALFLKAVKGLSLATGNDLLFRQAEESVKTIYGYVFRDPGALKLETSETATRLHKLQQAAQEATGEERSRIDAAIRAHEKRLEDLQGKLT